MNPTHSDSRNTGKNLNFNKITSRKHFSGSSLLDTIDMKKSSILFTGTSKPESSPVAPRTTLQRTFQHRKSEHTDSTSDVSDYTADQRGLMHCSVIVEKTNHFKVGPEPSTIDRVKELNDKAEELKRKLLQMAGKTSKQN